jgi:hypothetical protein
MPKVIAKFRFELLTKIRMSGAVSADSAQMVIDGDIVRTYPPAIFDDVQHQPKWSVTEEEATGSSNNEPTWNADIAIIDVEGEIKSVVIEESDEVRFLGAATQGLRRLLEVYRWRSGQYQIIIAGEKLYADYHVDYFDSEGNKTKTWRGTSGLGSLSITTFSGEKSSNNIWNEVRQDIISDNYPELWQNLIMDAYQAASTDSSSAVVKAGAACESFIEKFCDDHSKKQQVDQAVYKALTPRNRTFPEYFHIVLHYLFGRSLKYDEASLYKEIDNLHQTINFVRHEGRCQYKINNKIITVDSNVARQMITSAVHAIKWAKSLIANEAQANNL